MSLVDDRIRFAEQGEAAAQFNLGLMYATGQGVPQDDAEAAKWFRRARGFMTAVRSRSETPERLRLGR